MTPEQRAKFLQATGATREGSEYTIEAVIHINFSEADLNETSYDDAVEAVAGCIDDEKRNLLNKLK